MLLRPKFQLARNFVKISAHGDGSGKFYSRQSGEEVEGFATDEELNVNFQICREYEEEKMIGAGSDPGSPLAGGREAERDHLSGPRPAKMAT